MSATTWTKFYWADWESDERLKLCSPGAQALWMRMLCICAKADGYLVINRQKLEAEDLSALTGWPTADVSAWWAELAKWGVFSTDRAGRVYNRRMIRDAKRAKTARENGKNGGNPSLGKQTGNPASDNQNPTNTPGVRARINHKPSANSQVSPHGLTADGAFGQAWAAFPEMGRRRSAKAKAKAAWTKAAPMAGGEAALLASVVRFASDPDTLRNDGQYCPAMDRWLRDGRWEHFAAGLFEPKAAPTAAGGLFGIDAPSERQQRSWMEDWREKGRAGWRTFERGPYPGEPGCRVSAVLVAEFEADGAPA